MNGNPVLAKGAGRGSRRLQSGKRAQVAEAQRARVIAATVAVAYREGVANVTVARVVGHAGVSRRTFYELFVDAESCLLAAIEYALDCARRYVLTGYDPGKPWQARIRGGLVGLLAFVDEQPAMGRLLFVEMLGAGRQALERRAEVLAHLVSAVDAARREGAPRAGLTPLTAEGVVGAVLSVVHARLLAGEDESMMDLANPLMCMIVLPYHGAAAARRELAKDLPEVSLHKPGPAADEWEPLRRIPMRLTYRTMRVLQAIAATPGGSNRAIGSAAGIADQGQMSKLLTRLERLGLAVNDGGARQRGAPNAWTLTPRGVELERSVGGYPEPER